MPCYNNDGFKPFCEPYMDNDTAVGIADLLYLNTSSNFSKFYVSSEVEIYSLHYGVCSLKRTFVLDRFDTFV